MKRFATRSSFSETMPLKVGTDEPADDDDAVAAVSAAAPPAHRMAAKYAKFLVVSEMKRSAIDGGRVPLAMVVL